MNSKHIKQLAELFLETNNVSPVFSQMLTDFVNSLIEHGEVMTNESYDRLDNAYFEKHGFKYSDVDLELAKRFKIWCDNQVIAGRTTHKLFLDWCEELDIHPNTTIRTKVISDEEINDMAYQYYNSLERADHFPVSESLISAYKTGFISNPTTEDTFRNFIRTNHLTSKWEEYIKTNNHE